MATRLVAESLPWRASRSWIVHTREAIRVHALDKRFAVERHEGRIGRRIVVVGELDAPAVRKQVWFTRDKLAALINADRAFWGAGLGIAKKLPSSVRCSPTGQVALVRHI
jgi:hypothetical protein